MHLLNFLTLGVIGSIASLLLFLISLVIGLCGVLLGLFAYALNRGLSFCLPSRNFFYFAFDFLTDEFLFRYVEGLLRFVVTGGLLLPFRYVKQQINKIGYYETQIERFNNIKASFYLKLETNNLPRDDFFIGIKKKINAKRERTKSLDFAHMQNYRDYDSVK